MRSIETVLCKPCSSMTRQCNFTAIRQNGLRLCGIKLLYATAAIFSAMSDFVPDKGVCRSRRDRLADGRCYTNATVVIKFILLWRLWQMSVRSGA